MTVSTNKVYNTDNKKRLLNFIKRLSIFFKYVVKDLVGYACTILMLLGTKLAHLVYKIYF